MDILYSYYLEYLKSHGVDEAWAILSWFTMNFALIAAFMIIVVLALVLAERKLLAYFTVRKGPNRVGFWGCLQTVADAIKLLFKEDIIPAKADWLLFSVAPLFAFMPVICAWALIPYTSRFCVYNSVVGVLLILSLLSLPMFGVLLAGYSSNNKYSLVGSMRACVQAVSYELPLLMSVLSVALISGTFNLNNIVLQQSATLGIAGWFFLPTFIGMLVFFVASIAQLHRTPFDLPEAESELVAGYNTEYSGMKFALFFLGEYAAMFIVAMFFVNLFWGGYLPPFGMYVVEKLDLDFVLTQVLIYWEQFFWLMLKTSIVIFLIIWVRATLPRLRADQMTEFAWKILFPLSIFNFIIVAIFKYVKVLCV